MTSTEFAARYRLLKNVATRGARSFLAQQVELGRMVMVHYLDSEKPQERAATLARLEALTSPARSKLVEIADVDGSPVAVTLFISSFVDFATWLDAVSPDLPAPPPLPPPSIAAPPAASAPGAFTQAFQKLDLPRANIIQASAPNEERPAPPRPASDFTSIFGKIDESVPAESSAASASEESGEEDSPTLIMEPPNARHVSEPVQAPPPPPAPSEGGFTAIFGRLNETSLPASSAPRAWPEPVAPALSIPAPSLSPPSMSPPITPLPQPALGNVPAQPKAPPAYTEPAQPGEFTQLFQRISPAGGSRVPSFAPPPAPFRAPEIPRSIETTPAADLPRPTFSDPYGPPPTVPLPSLGAPPSSPPPMSLGEGGPPSLGAVPAFLAPPAPNFSDAPPAPSAPNVNGVPRPPAAPPPVWGASALPPALGNSLDVGVQSEFTRILGRVAVPPPPPLPMAPAQGGPAGASKAPTKSMMPLLVALNVVVLLTIGILAYFMFRKH